MADELEERNVYRLEQWARIISECQASGESNRRFCQNRGISEKTYYYWLRKLRVMTVEKAAPELIKLEAAEQLGEEKTLGTEIRIRYHDAQLELPAGADSAAIAAVLAAIKGLC